MTFAPIPESDEDLARKIIGAAIEVHRTLGAGFLESIYRRAPYHELALLQLKAEQEKEILVPYKDLLIPGQRLDILVAGRIILELKTVDKFAPIHEAQLISYLKATGLRLGFLLNFKVTIMKHGIKRIVL